MRTDSKIGIFDTSISREYSTFAIVETNINMMSPTHGDICTSILNKNMKSAQVFNIKTLDDKGFGLVDNLSNYLEQGVNNSICIINMSFGTINFLDKFYIKKTINHYANKGIIIIAATSNDGYIAYPASLSNVISVAAGDRLEIDHDMQLQKGIDFIAPSDHEITIEGATFRLGKSNSYAAPYVTAMVGNLINEKGMMTIDEIRRTLAPEGTIFIYSPDWIEKAWISPEYRKRDTDFYFDEDERNLQFCMDEIDTLILCTRSEMERYGDLEKHIVYLGDDYIRPSCDRKRYWNKKMRLEQIMSSKEKENVLDIPIICCVFSSETDIIKTLCELKRLFADDGYNAFTGCSHVDSPLYDLEYLPCESDIQNKLEDFIYWQTYYQQSDLILIGTDYVEDGLPFSGNPADMVVTFKYADDRLRVGISIDGGASVEKAYSISNTNTIKEIYHSIVMCFDKKEDE